MSDVALDYGFCPVCAVDQLLEVPPCADGHGQDCPDRACASCGTGLWLDSVPDTPAVRRSTVTRYAA